MKILENASLRNYNSFRVEAHTKYLVFIEKEPDLEQFFSRTEVSDLPLFILGGGSNCLFQQDFQGTILKMGINGLTHEKKETYIEVKAGAGEPWNDLVNYCLQNNIAGLENLSLIPGTVGAAPIQNIGAYGVEFKDHFYSLKAFHINTRRFQYFSKEECHFSYRNSIFKGDLKNQYIITEVIFRFPMASKLNMDYGAIQDELKKEIPDKMAHEIDIQDISRVVSKIRIEKLPDPSQIGNAGSFFKNPIISESIWKQLKIRYPNIVYYHVEDGNYKLAAGWLIEYCGWKGKNMGHVGTWANQALVIVNLGEATGKEIMGFAEKIIQSVENQFGIKLEPEVNLIGS